MMKNKLSKLALASLLSLSAASANAAAYSFSERYVNPIISGDYTNYILSSNASHALTIDSKTYSDKFSIQNHQLTSGSYSFTATTKTGDQLFGTYTYSPKDSGFHYFDAIYSGGTGLFAGATGTGKLISGYDILVVQTSVTTAAVPEADTSAMLLMGAGVMGFMARRRKQVAA